MITRADKLEAISRFGLMVAGILGSLSSSDTSMAKSTG